MGEQVNSFLQELRVKPLHDFHCLETFCSGVESMDIFIRNDFRMSVENHYCAAYVVTYQDEVVAVFALSFDSLDLDSDDKEELEAGISSTGTPDVDWNYKDTFYSKPRYPALDIAYLAVQGKWRGQGSMLFFRRFACYFIFYLYFCTGINKSRYDSNTDECRTAP